MSIEHRSSPGLRTGLVLALGVIVLALGACQTDAQTGALIGAGVGAGIGQAAGGDTKSTVIGAGAGAILGGVIGNESDKQKERGK